MADNPAPLRNSSFADDLAKRGVAFPLAGFAPGGYSVPCRTCARRFTGDKRASRCLPCAVKTAIATGSEARDEAEREGELERFDRIDDLRKVVVAAIREADGPKADIEEKWREVRLWRDGHLACCIPTPHLAGVDADKIPQIVRSYLDAFDFGRSSVSQGGGQKTGSA
ncbi:MAG TPA: hypothetical protein ENH55_11360 [Aurantimonas coralicida]|uniref:Uncharacterized protein n=2 Tax=root TaxID=1 RepID=A0A9C9NHI1_9HYPH|nr:hypothetical protein [Aurantimonas coralicida]HEU01807.1 hypothetical protein [Aurantimonas coralicida]